MALNTSGPISIGGPTVGQSINLEFARAASQQTSMSQLYRGGPIVPNASLNNAVPTSGPISLSQLRGATRRIQVTIDITSNQNNYVFNTAKVPGYVAGITDVIFNIAGGVVISATSTGVYAGNVDTSWSAGDTIRINNSGVIVGAGGGGGGGQFSAAPGGGGSGGPALIVQRATSISNGGIIAGGGGGGGGGQGFETAVGDGKGGTSISRSVGGGGGGGRSSAAVNAPGGPPTGGTGTYSGPGGGGGGLSDAYSTGTPGAAGGDWGAGGGTSLYGGGPGGVAVAGNGNISWVATGTRLGAIT